MIVSVQDSAVAASLLIRSKASSLMARYRLEESVVIRIMQVSATPFTHDMHEKDITLIREIGANSIRLAHYQHAQNSMICVMSRVLCLGGNTNTSQAI
jgi:hypothetical protein